MPRITSAAYLGHPGDTSGRGDLPFYDISVLASDSDEISLMVDDEEHAYAADGWGIILTMTRREARILSMRINELVADRLERNDPQTEVADPE